MSSSSEESDDEDEFMSEQDKRKKDMALKASEKSPECMQVEKLLKYLLWGNKTVTIIVLCLLRDCNLTQETIQLTILEAGGLDLLLNLLDTDDLKCKIGSLRILKEISKNVAIRKAIRDAGGLKTIVSLTKSQNKDLKCLSSETIANVAKSGKARRAVRHYGGLKRLVAIIEIARDRKLNQFKTEEELKQNLEVTRCAALALSSCCKSDKNKKAMRKVGVLPVLAELILNITETSILRSVMDIFQECASDPNYIMAIRSLGLIEPIVRHISSEDVEIKMHCASAIQKVCEDKQCCEMIRKHGALLPLTELLNDVDDKPLCSAATGAIWKCSTSALNAEVFEQVNVLDKLIAFLELNEPEEVRINCSGAIASLAQRPQNRPIIRKKNGIKLLINQIGSTTIPLLVNATDAIGVMAEDQESIDSITKYDGIRLLWSLLKNPAWQVQASAAGAMCPCFKNMEDAGEEVRAFVGGIELMMTLLKSEHIEVLAAICNTVAQIAQDDENLAIMTDLCVVQLLSDLTSTKNDTLKVVF